MAGNRFSWFNNRSLRFKLTALFLLVLVIMQLASGILVTNVVERKMRDDLLASNQAALRQMAVNVDEILMNIVENLYPVLTETHSVQLRRPSGLGDAEAADPAGDMEYITNNIEFQRLFNQLLSSRNNYRFIHSMLVAGQDGAVYSYFSSSYYALNGQPLFETLRSAYGQDEAYIWTGVLAGDYFFSRCPDQIISLIVPVRLYRRAHSFVVLNISVARLRSYLADMSGENSGVYLQTRAGDLISGWPLEDAEVEEALFSDGVDTARHGEHVLLTVRLTVNGFPLSILYSDGAVDGFALLLRAIIPLLIGVGAVMMVSSGFIVSKVTKPLCKLTEIICTNTTDRGRRLRFHARYRDEVGALGSAYNQMMDDLEREQRQKRAAYMKMLQMQIKPHFLYNSMESTRFLVEMGDRRAVDMIRAIVTYYKLSLSGADELVPIRREFEQLECYLQILQIRYASRYDYDLDIAEDMLGDEIEKFTLQPLVENAIYHGIKMKRGKGHIRIRGFREDGQNIIEVLDNGIGIPEAKMRELRGRMRGNSGMAQTDHIGVLNVHQRLCMRYGPEYGLRLDSVPGDYTRVRVVIPAIQWRGVEEAADD